MCEERKRAKTNSVTHNTTTQLSEVKTKRKKKSVTQLFQITSKKGRKQKREKGKGKKDIDHRRKKQKGKGKKGENKKLRPKNPTANTSTIDNQVGHPQINS